MENNNGLVFGYCGSWVGVQWGFGYLVTIICHVAPGVKACKNNLDILHFLTPGLNFWHIDDMWERKDENQKKEEINCKKKIEKYQERRDGNKPSKRSKDISECDILSGRQCESRRSKDSRFVFYIICFIFWPTFRCCAHLKAG